MGEYTCSQCKDPVDLELDRRNPWSAMFDQVDGETRWFHASCIYAAHATTCCHVGASQAQQSMAAERRVAMFSTVEVERHANGEIA